MGDLQEDVSVDNVHKKITGTLKYVTDYTGFSGDVTEQSGNYLVTHWEGDENAVITAQLLPAERVVTLDSDGLLISRISNKDTQKLKITTTVNEDTSSAIYSLKDLFLEEEEGE